MMVERTAETRRREIITMKDVQCCVDWIAVNVKILLKTLNMEDHTYSAVLP